jgi:hypothetical protein
MHSHGDRTSIALLVQGRQPSIHSESLLVVSASRKVSALCSLKVVTTPVTLVTLFKVLGNLRYLGLVVSKLGQDLAMPLVIWPVLCLTFFRAVTYNFAPRTKLQRRCCQGRRATTGMAHYKNGVVSFEVGGSFGVLKFIETMAKGIR